MAGGGDRGGFEVGRRWRQYRILGWPAVEIGGFGLADRRWRWEAMGDCLEMGYGLLGYSLEREIICIEFFRVFSF